MSQPGQTSKQSKSCHGYQSGLLKHPLGSRAGNSFTFRILRELQFLLCQSSFRCANKSTMHGCGPRVWLYHAIFESVSPNVSLSNVQSCRSLSWRVLVISVLLALLLFKFRLRCLRLMQITGLSDQNNANLDACLVAWPKLRARKTWLFPTKSLP